MIHLGLANITAMFCAIIKAFRCVYKWNPVVLLILAQVIHLEGYIHPFALSLCAHVITIEKLGN